MEGFEHYLESIFGPTRPFNSKKLQDQIPKLRWARNAPSAEAIKSKVDNVDNVIENEFGRPKVFTLISVLYTVMIILLQQVFLGLKIFGNDLMYASLHGENEIKAAINTLNPFDYIKQILSGRVRITNRVGF